MKRMRVLHPISRKGGRKGGRMGAPQVGRTLHSFLLSSDPGRYSLSWTHCFPFHFHYFPRPPKRGRAGIYCLRSYTRDRMGELSP